MTLWWYRNVWIIVSVVVDDVIVIVMYFK